MISLHKSVKQNFFFFFQNIYSFERQKAFIHWFSSQMLTISRARSGWSLELGMPSQPSTWVSGTRLHGSSFIPFPGTFMGNCIGNKGARTWTRNSDMGCVHPKLSPNPLVHKPVPQFFLVSIILVFEIFSYVSYCYVRIN